MSLSRVIEVARGELGQTEDPAGSNRVKYWDAYDKAFQGQPWCVSFLWWVFDKAGERMAFFGGGKTASCSILLRWYKEQGLTVPVEQVQVGDIVILNFHGKQEPEHCGLVVGRSDITDLSTGIPYSIWTIEGNTSASDGSQSNGGMVCEKIRYPRYIVAVCRPQYKPETGVPSSGPSGHLPPGEGKDGSDGPAGDGGKDDITGHWAEDSIRWCVEHGLMKGYPDGSFQPDKPVTRAELATVLRRFDVYTEQLWESDVMEKMMKRITELETQLAMAVRLLGALGFDEDRII